MRKCAVLIAPSANRVYGKRSADLALAELAAIAPYMHFSPREINAAKRGGVDYLLFEMDDLDEHDQIVLSNLSGTFALFEVADDESLRPLDLEALGAFDTDLISIQRYTGKTNEQFTHLLVNVALAASAAARERSTGRLPVRLLDPVAGRGTTLNRGLMYGFDVAGIELSGADFDAYRTFLTTYLKDVRRGFKLEEATVRKGEQAGSKRFTVKIGKSQRVESVRGDTSSAAEYFGARSFDLLVADLPYGVRHGSTSTATGSLARSPLELVRDSVRGWRALLRSGAGAALAWNTKTMARSDLQDALTTAGFTVADTPHSFEHKVDRAIVRDVVVATT